MSDIETVTCNNPSFVSVDSDGALTIQFNNDENTRSAIMGLGYDGEPRNWYSLFAKEPMDIIGPIEATGLYSALETINAWFDK